MNQKFEKVVGSKTKLQNFQLSLLGTSEHDRRMLLIRWQLESNMEDVQKAKEYMMKRLRRIFETK